MSMNIDSVWYRSLKGHRARGEGVKLEGISVYMVCKYVRQKDRRLIKSRGNVILKWNNYVIMNLTVIYAIPCLLSTPLRYFNSLNIILRYFKEQSFYECSQGFLSPSTSCFSKKPYLRLLENRAFMSALNVSSLLVLLVFLKSLKYRYVRWIKISQRYT